MNNGQRIDRQCSVQVSTARTSIEINKMSQNSKALQCWRQNSSRKILH